MWPTPDLLRDRRRIPTPCIAWNGHRFIEAKTGTFIYCTVCGEIVEVGK